MAKKIEKTKNQTAFTEQEFNRTDEQESRIAELAYFKAERRGFSPNHELTDWLEAEQEYFAPQSDKALDKDIFALQVEA